MRSATTGSSTYGKSADGRTCAPNWRAAFPWRPEIQVCSTMTKRLTGILFALLLIVAAVTAADEPIKIRGYYFTFGRMPTFGLAEWKQIYDRIHSDGGNTVLLWVGGGFRSRKFPVTWQYNRDHKNI